MTERLKKFKEKIDSYKKDIFDFSGQFYLTKNHIPEKEGFYITIRCGLGGIYQCLNQWKDGMWQMEILDGSSTIAYSRNTVKLEVDE